MQIDRARFEFFLEDGWDLIGQLHQWLSKWPMAADDGAAMIDLIRSLQSLWAVADDLELRRLARTTLAIEQLLERFCAQTLDFTVDRMKDVTAAVGNFQDLLLGLEATGEEPSFSDIDSVIRLERHSLEEVGFDRQMVADIAQNPEVSTYQPIQSMIPVVESSEIVIDPAFPSDDGESGFVEHPLLMMLEHFAERLESTSRQLHARVLADEAPYVATTSRLEHLAQATRELVGEIVQKPRRTTFVEETTTGTDCARPLAIADVITPQSYTPIADLLPALQRPIVMEVLSKPQRVLIVEESMFFRHLIDLALRSAGYRSYTADSVNQAMELLNYSPPFSAILVSSAVAADLFEAIEESRRINGTFVVGMMTSESDPPAVQGFDEYVPRSQPQQLVAILDEVYSDPAEPVRQSA